MEKQRELQAIAKVIFILTKEVVENSTTSIRDAYRYVLREITTPTLASEAAYNDFYLKTGKDIREFDWRSSRQITSKNGEKFSIHKVYTGDHVQTCRHFETMLRKAYENGLLTEDLIIKQLSNRYVCWITKDEDKRLNELGYQSNRPDPEKAYREAGIVIYSPLADENFPLPTTNKTSESAPPRCTKNICNEQNDKCDDDNVEIIGQKVTHTTYGEGIVVWLGRNVQSNKLYIKIKFKDKTLDFPYPTAFEKFITALDADFRNHITREIASLQKTAETKVKDLPCSVSAKKSQPQVHKAITYCSKNTFIFKNEMRFNKARKRYGFITLDTEGRIVAVAAMHEDKRGAAYGQAELCFYDEYKSEFGEWRLIAINKERLSFSKLTEILEANSSYKVTIDPRKGS